MQIPYLVRELVGYTFISVIPIAFTLPVIFFMGIWWGVLGLFVGLIVSITLGIVLMKHEFTPLLRGKGILAIDLNSTGVLRPFIVNVFPPFLKGTDNGKVVNDIFDRKAVFNFVTPKKIESIKSHKKGIFDWFLGKKKADIEVKSGACMDEDGNLFMRLDAEEYQKSRFGFKQYPCVIWNSQVNSFLTKEFLSEQEKEAFAEHAILNQNKLLEETNRMIWHLCRNTIDLLNPQKGQLMKTIFWVILIIGILLLGIFFVPKIIEFFSGGMGGIVGSAQSQVVTPR